MELISTKQIKILVVDDNPDNIQVIGNILKESGYIVGFAIEGKQALNLLHNTNDYDLVLLDVDMPVMNGYETCRAMRLDEQLRDLPVIFLTAFVDIENKITGFDAGAQDYVTKPYHPHELLSRVRTHVELKRNREKLSEVNKWLADQVKDKTRELENALLALSRLDKIKTNYLFQISEEIKMPLNGILGTINLVKNEDRSSAVKDMIDILEISLSRLEGFVSKAVFSTQLSAKNYTLNISQFNLDELIKYSIIELNNALQDKNLSVKIDSMSSHSVIMADKDLIFKALNYLIDNAVKFSQNEGTISIALKSVKDNITLDITDNGPGFSDKELNELLSPYGSESDMPEARTGISLQLVKQIMDLHKGKINIENNTAGGARIQLIFNS